MSPLRGMPPAASADDIRGALRAAGEHHAAALPRWRTLLERVLGGDEQLTTDQKAELLGLPGRRQFLRVGGAAVAGAVLLAACSDDNGDEAAVPAPSGPDTTVGPESSEAIDIVLANTALSLEVLLIDTHAGLVESGIIERAVLMEALTLFREHHQAHADVLFALVEAAGGTPFTTANPLVKTQLVDPRVASATTEAELLQVARDLETAAGETYVFATSALSTAELRSTAMSIAGVESRHAAILGNLADDEIEAVFPEPVFPADNPLSDDALVTG